VRRIVGGGDLWVTEFILSYDGKPSYTVSIMERRQGCAGDAVLCGSIRSQPGPHSICGGDGQVIWKGRESLTVPAVIQQG
jgi:hypothetical protein